MVFTCAVMINSFNQLDLPSYGSEEETREKLLLAIKEGSEGFAFA